MRTRNLHLLAASVVASSLALVSCGPGAAASAVRPSDPTAANALGEAACLEVAGKQGEPLVIDWAPEQRGDLEVAMKDGVAVVAYSCKSIKVLADCHIDGKYGFMGTTRNEQVVQLANADELSANLPLSGAKISSELARGSTIDIAMIMVGKRRTTWDAPTKADLKGHCDGATHYVRSATVGAFAMDTGTEGKVRAAAEMFGAGGKGESTSSKKVQTKQGEIADCNAASPDADKAPAQCGAPIRLLLNPIAEAPAKPTPDTASTSAPSAPPPARFSRPEEADACPQGMVFSGGKCTKPSDVAVHTCKASDVQDCSAQCDKNDVVSCALLGAHYASANDAAKAGPPLKKACDAGEAHACTNLGVLAEGGGSRDAGTAALFQKGCAGGDAIGCRHYGATLAGKDDGKAFAAYQKACEGGDPAGCGLLGTAYANGAGVARDPAKGADYKRRACDGGDARSCADVAALLESGKVIGKNEVLSRIYYERGCLRDPRGAPDACTGLGRATWKQNPQLAKMWFDRGCAFGDPVGCATLKVLYGENRPLVVKAQVAQEAQTACIAGDMRACTTQGLLQSAQGMGAMSKPNVQRACQSGDALACELAKKP